MYLERLSSYNPKPFGVNREFAVGIILFGPKEDKKIIFEIRSSTVSQPNDVSLPGGKKEDGESLYECVLREIEEEIGIPKEDLEYVGKSDYVVEPIGVVYPFVFNYKYDDLSRLVLNSEVDDVFSVECSYFKKVKPRDYSHNYEVNFPKDFPYELLPNGNKYKFYPVVKTVYMYEDIRPLLWGLTAKIIMGFTKIIYGENNG